MFGKFVMLFVSNMATLLLLTSIGKELNDIIEKEEEENRRIKANQIIELIREAMDDDEEKKKDE